MSFDYPAVSRWFDVHYWPREGRVTLINANPHYAGLFVMTTLTVEPEGVDDMVSTTTLTASAIGRAADPPCYTIIRHDADGSVWSVDSRSYAATRINGAGASARH